MSVLTWIMRNSETQPLMEAMIEKLGLTSAMRRLPDRRGVLARASARCALCERPDSCAEWLAENTAADEAPYFCRNHDLFERVLAMTREEDLPHAV